MSEKPKNTTFPDGEMLDLSSYSWDERRLTDILTRIDPINVDQARDISRALREEIARRELREVTIPLLEKIVEEKLREYGITKKSPVKLDTSMFVKKEPLSLSPNARMVLERRYLRKDDGGNVIETPEEMFRRVARSIAKAEEDYGGDREWVEEIEESFYHMMTSFRFLPNSPTLMNAGRELGQLAACFVLPVEDSMEGIFDALKNAALIHKSGGGTGFSFSRLRPKNSKVGSTGGVASGPVSFMKIFNTATEQVKQGGTRRGANMAILRVDHPDIMEFITCKKNNRELNNFNISVGITDAFMEAVKEGKSYSLVDPRDGKVVGQLDATEVYYSLIYHAWESGDPGVVFLDRVNRDNPTPALGEIESTNPCGEQPLLPLEACNLGSVNLAKFVTNTNGTPSIDFKRLKETVWLSVRFLDNVIDVSKYPLPEIEKRAKGNRKIGLGVMGFADTLFMLGVAYDSDRALDIAERVMAFIQKESHDASRYLAEKRGVFENYDISIYKDMENCRFRNATTTTIAPTGTLSIIAGCSSGIEPLFAISFVRRVMDNDELVEVNPYFENIARKRGFYSPELMRAIARKGSIQNIEGIPDDVKKVFVTAHDIAPEWHVRMQAAFQKYTDNAVSKTVNLPRDATVEDVKAVYDLAYELGCKGVTIYRSGSKANQVLSFEEEEKGVMPPAPDVKERPETLEGFTTKVVTGMGNLYVTVTEYDGKPFEVFATIGKSGKSTTAKTEAIGRLVSLALRSGVPVEKIVEQLKGICGEHPVFQKDGLILSIPDAISRVLEKKYLKDKKITRQKHENSLLGEICPECGQKIAFEEGCMTCHFCGFTKCG
ncbi:MAG: vitamin B12-dependent ribonucleotide reductase [Deltaproteobacteria bacterium]|nr:vitamin B12-dependent ribonucleotide reductase [Deltaproteobacteria bacterium]MBW1936268.1 vitamin B12-dependent ribonucleotide reductase [Deltaproteobacteria bacterium]MBW1976682.1 vitamin B12-dependent ribonucleotide reductase [Deltaproteobacteria bacterium]MBW2045961.1 vitamin B12-dependent ribonucleotide reductase [Deltaproteobacteria bacterium]MBW2299256.1 vitamin B12-dependent ribonucleotide reductase [Deltaproteobacteria bacterium]